MTSQAFPTCPLSVEAITLERGGIPLIRDLSISAAPGEAIVLLGRNGVGKTTFLRALAGVLLPSSGEIRYAEERADRAAAQACAFLAHDNALKPDETPRQSLQFWSALAGGTQSVGDALDALGLRPLADRPSRNLSQGQKRRAAIARLLVQDKPVWLLDEPAAPLDADGRQRLSRLVEAHRGRGGIVIAATHQDLEWPGARVEELVR
ncbi:heme ABC exporter ATP-binding protein CcmA [Hyphobacterium sp. HN65]|uniref:Heme ABC exporter ATP-binding protein CcmA n=1 Tax=Hyphobacterium lacteum TaxID=3116575 RepID=A0ABU7LS77_9PROT|nr:heme ABC exporter ATP-binding protein CcmA [Hyphobacterium sp. HN65]MEE2526748.1 heme ABC exporter ATP-binding protein CcmA [Hyphobacterium sp. HN65]